ALSVDGVRDAIPLVVGVGRWRAPSGLTSPVFIVGADKRDDGLRPWNFVEGSLQSLAVPGAIAIDQAYFDRLETRRIGESAEINDQTVKVMEITHGIRSFTTMPYVFVSPDLARTLTGTPPNKASYFIIHLSAGVNAVETLARLRARLVDADVLTPDEFGRRSKKFWVSGTGAGAALLMGSLLALIVGTVIVAQTLYSSTKDHLPEFGTQRAIGSSGGYIVKVIIIQALLSAFIGFCLAAGIGWTVVRTTADTALPVIITPAMIVMLLLLTVFMSVLSAVMAIMKVMRIDPVIVLTR